MTSFMIAVDGPAGSGKGTLAKRLAQHYNLAHLDTGLLYRGVGWKLIHINQPTDNVKLATIAAQNLTPQDLNDPHLRSDEAAVAASQVAQYPQVREALFSFQKNFIQHPPKNKKGVILDGRDVGTIICPQAPYKFFITASLEIRAKRRLEELKSRNIAGIYEDVFQDMHARDLRDQAREVAPLRPAQDAIVIDSSDKNADNVFRIAQEYIDTHPCTEMTLRG